MLSAHAEITAGHPFRSRIPATPGSGVVVVQMKDTSDQGVDWAHATETSAVTASPAWLRDGDILLAARGNQNYAVLVADAPKKALAGPHWYVIRCKDNKLLPAFLAWQLNSKPVQERLRLEAAGTHTRNLRRESLAKLAIAVPPLEEQQRIVAFAEAARRERELCERLMATTERLNEGLARRLLNRNHKAS